MPVQAVGQLLRSRIGLALVCATVALASVLIYLPSIEYEFAWDDTSLISENAKLAGTGPASSIGHASQAVVPPAITGPVRCPFSATVVSSAILLHRYPRTNR